ncbi:MAG: prephenate dehydrogenase/arogenate dehydrogenase family protein [Ilumatobacteraceae bacterium]
MSAPDQTLPAGVANVVGLGLIGGSIAYALTARGWTVHGVDIDTTTVDRALALGAISASGLSHHAELTFIAVPVDQAAEAVEHALTHTDGPVTDVGSVKSPLCSRFSDPRFVGGHPMAGSELDGLDGADGGMFDTAIWVLTPSTATDDAVLSTVAGVIRSLGAEVVALDPSSHDRLVAVVSHVPHLTAATLMGLAAERSEEHAALLRLAAGGFRDMTRIASGSPGIWIDICRQNRHAICEALEELESALSGIREIIESGDDAALYERLSAARSARANLPSRVADPASLAEIRIAIPDRTGAAAEIFTLAAELGVNIANFEVVHSAEGARGVAVVLVDTSAVDLYRGGLVARGFRPSVHQLS